MNIELGKEQINRLRQFYADELLRLQKYPDDVLNDWVEIKQYKTASGNTLYSIFWLDTGAKALGFVTRKEAVSNAKKTLIAKFIGLAT